MTHDYQSHGTATLFAAREVLEGEVIGRCMQRHRHEEFLRFLNAVSSDVPTSKSVHVILDNYATHRYPARIAWGMIAYAVMALLARHKRFSF